MPKQCKYVFFKRYLCAILERSKSSLRLTSGRKNFQMFLVCNFFTVMALQQHILF